MSRLRIVAAFIRRDFEQARSYRLPFALELLSVGFSLVLFFYLAKVVDAGEAVEVPGLETGYFGFVVVGMVVLRVVQSALTGFASRLGREQTTGTLEALLATPTSPSLVILSSAAYDLLQATAFGGVMLAGAAAMGMPLAAGPAGTGVAAVTLLGLLGLFTALGVLLAAFAVVFKQVTGVLGLFTAALSLLGGVWFPVELLPGPVRWLAEALPFTWGIQVLRAALLGQPVEAWQVAGLILTAALALPVSLAVFRIAVDRARAKGTLSQY